MSCAHKFFLNKNNMPRFAKYRRSKSGRSTPRNMIQAMKSINSGKFVFPSSYDAYAGLKALQRKWDKKENVSKIGFAYGKSTCRVHEVDLGTTVYVTRALSQVDLLNIPKLSTSFTMDSRFRDVINLSGIRLSYILSNINVNDNTLWNICLLGTRDRTNGDIATTNFFRNSSGSDRGLDFSTALDANVLHNSPINTDDYVVLYRKKFNLAARTSDASSVQIVNDYIPLQRQVRYDGSGDPHQGLRLVFWCDSAAAAGGSAQTTNLTKLGMRALVFFKDEN